MVVLHTCKNEDLIKNEGARMLTRLYDIFSEAQGQLTPKSVAEFLLSSSATITGSRISIEPGTVRYADISPPRINTRGPMVL